MYAHVQSHNRTSTSRIIIIREQRMPQTLGTKRYRLYVQWACFPVTTYQFTTDSLLGDMSTLVDKGMRLQESCNKCYICTPSTYTHRAHYTGKCLNEVCEETSGHPKIAVAIV